MTAFSAYKPTISPPDPAYWTKWNGAMDELDSRFGTAATFAAVTLTGVLALAAGSVGTPGLNLGDGSTGLYRPSADVLGFSISGTQRLAINSAGVLVGGAVAGGPANGTDGGLLLRGQYAASSYIATVSEFNGTGGAVLGYGVEATNAAATYSSSTPLNIARGAVMVDNTGLHYLASAAQTTAYGSAVTMAEYFTVGLTGVVTMPAYGTGGVVSVGAVDSGGAGYKVLRVPN